MKYVAPADVIILQFINIANSYLDEELEQYLKSRATLKLIVGVEY